MDLSDAKYIFDQKIQISYEDRKSFYSFKLFTTGVRLIVVEITDVNDPLFLFTLQINENDFHSLKQEQDLTVGFLDFPFTLLELLNNQDGQYSFSLNSSGRFNVIEGRKIRSITHISLQLKPANDSTLKKYLASKLGEFKNQCATLESMNGQLENRLEDTRKKMEHTNKLIEVREIDHTNVFAQYKVDQSNLLNEEKERSVAKQLEAKHHHDEEMKKSQRSHELELLQMRNQIQRLQDHISETNASKNQLEDDLKTISNRLHSTELELSKCKSESNNELRIKISAFEQKLLDKDEIINKMSSLLENSNTQKITMEESINTYKTNTSQLEEKVSTLKQEIKKGNQIIQHLQNQYNKCKSTMKSAIANNARVEQEYKEKQSDSEKQSDEIEQMRRIVDEKNSQLERMQETIEKQKQQIENDEDLIKKNENIITYLNKELNKMKSSSNSTILSDRTNNQSNVTLGIDVSNTPSSYQFRPSWKTLNTLPLPLKNAPMTPTVTTTSTNVTPVQYNPHIMKQIK